MIDIPEIIHTTAQPAAVIHLTVPRSEIQKVMGPGYAELMSTLDAQGIKPAGRWFTHHFRMQPETFDFEIGVPVAEPVKAAGRVNPGELPARRVARTIYHGPYEGLSSAWGEFDRWIKANGLTPDGSVWERYVTDPGVESDSAKYETELMRPLV